MKKQLHNIYFKTDKTRSFLITNKRPISKAKFVSCSNMTQIGYNFVIESLLFKHFSLLPIMEKLQIITAKKYNAAYYKHSVIMFTLKDTESGIFLLIS